MLPRAVVELTLGPMLDRRLVLDGEKCLAKLEAMKFGENSNNQPYLAPCRSAKADDVGVASEIRSCAELSASVR